MATDSKQPIIVTGGGGGGWVTPVLLLAGVGFAYWKFGKPYFDEQEQKKRLQQQQGSTVTTSTVKDPKTGKDVKVNKLFDLRGKPIKSANLATIASDINAGLHPGWYNPTDQERVIRAFMNTPYGMVDQLEQMFLQNYQENLRDTMVDKLADENWIKVKNYFK